MEQEVERIAAKQHGVVTRDQALGAGMSASTVDRRVRAGLWVGSGHPGVYVVHPRSGAAGWRQRLCAAVLGGPAETVASHRAAAVLHGLREGQEIELTVPPGARHGALAHQGVVLAAQRTTIDSIAVTRVERTLVDLASVVGDNAVELAVEAALRHGLTTVERVEAQVGGRRGSERLRRVLARRSGGRPCGSDLAMRVIQLLRAAGLPEPVREYEVRVGKDRYFIDLAYPERRLAIEIDGRESHDAPAAFQHDRTRQNRLVLMGWTVLRFTWADVTQRPERVVEVVATAMNAA